MAIKRLTKKELEDQNKKQKTRFGAVLSIISIVGFTEIILQSFFDFSIRDYSSFLWLLIMGIGFIIITQPKNLYNHSKEGFNENSFAKLTTFVIGCMAIVAGVLSLPFIEIVHPILYATMGVISIISIIFIAFQQWVVKE